MITDDEKWHDCITTLPEWLADVGEIVNIASAHAHLRPSIDRGTTNVWVFEHIAGVPMDRIVDKRDVDWRGGYCIKFVR
jgi:hypothetical protein